MNTKNERAYYVTGCEYTCNSETNKFGHITTQYKSYPLIITIVSSLIKTENTYELKFGWTFLNRNDEPNKIVGRNIAKIRLNDEDEYFGSFVISEPRFNDINKKILNHILNDPKTPKKYTRIIRYELANYEEM